MTIAASGNGAVAPGTDLSLHARELRVTHDAVLSGARPRQAPRDVVVRSWRRVLAEGLEAQGRNLRDPLPIGETERRREASPIALVIDELRHVLTGVADASTFLMVVADADGVVLWREGSARVRRQADTLGFTEGAVWTERTVGTNAIIQKKGVKVGLITTKGHNDVIHIMRGSRGLTGQEIRQVVHIPESRKPDPIVPKALEVPVWA